MIILTDYDAPPRPSPLRTPEWMLRDLKAMAHTETERVQRHLRVVEVRENCRKVNPDVDFGIVGGDTIKIRLPERFRR